MILLRLLYLLMLWLLLLLSLSYLSQSILLNDILLEFVDDHWLLQRLENILLRRSFLDIEWIQVAACLELVQLLLLSVLVLGHFLHHGSHL